MTAHSALWIVWFFTIAVLIYRAKRVSIRLLQFETEQYDLMARFEILNNIVSNADTGLVEKVQLAKDCHVDLVRQVATVNAESRSAAASIRKQLSELSPALEAKADRCLLAATDLVEQSERRTSERIDVLQDSHNKLTDEFRGKKSTPSPRRSSSWADMQRSAQQGELARSQSEV